MLINKTERPAAAPTLDGEVARQNRLAALENMPMSRYTCSLPVRELPGRGSVSLGEVTQLLERQNALLCDILCTLNALAATRAAGKD